MVLTQTMSKKFSMLAYTTQNSLLLHSLSFLMHARDEDDFASEKENFCSCCI